MPIFKEKMDAAFQAIQKKDWQNAGLISLELIDLNPTIAESYALAILAMRHLQLFEKAESLAKVAINNLPPNFAILMGYANIAIAQNQFEEAYKRYKEVFKYFPSEPTLYDNLIPLSEHLGYKNEKFYFIRKHQNYRFLSYRDKTDLPRYNYLKRFFDSNNPDERLRTIANGDICYRPREKGTPIRIGFLFQSLAQRENLIPLIDKMIDDEDFEIVIIATNRVPDQPYNTKDWFVTNYLQTDRLQIVGHEDASQLPDLYSLNLDILFWQMPYMYSLPLDYHPICSAMHIRTAYTAYAFSSGMGRKDVYGMGLMDSMWKFYAESEMAAEHYKQYGRDETVKTVGNIKIENLRNILNQKGNYPVVLKPITGRKPKILFNTHFTGNSFYNYHDIIIELARTRKYDITYRPHPYTRSKMNEGGVLSFAEFDKKIQDIIDAGVNYDNGDSKSSYADALMEADLFISSMTSLVFEYSITRRPVLYLKDKVTDEHYHGDFYKKYIEDCLYTCANPHELPKLVEEIFANYTTDPKIENREKFWKEQNFLGDTDPSDLIIQDIKTSLDAESS